MCKIAEYPELYNRAEELLRGKGLDRVDPGYEFLRKAIVISKVEGEKNKKKQLLKEVSKGMVVPSNKKLQKSRDRVEQWMIEALKSVSIDIELMDFIKQMAKKI